MTAATLLSFIGHLKDCVRVSGPRTRSHSELRTAGRVNFTYDRFPCGLSIGDYPPNFSYEVQKLAKRTLEDFRPLTERVRYLNQSARVKCSDVVCFP
jgi:hypothetical protein